MAADEFRVEMEKRFQRGKKVFNLTLETSKGKDPFTVEVWTPNIAKVELVGWTNDPEQVLAKTTLGYQLRYSNDPVPEEEVDRLLQDIGKTRLATTLEMVHFTWLITDVTRAWTHQAVRYRIGSSFVQESMRILGAGNRVFRYLMGGELARNPGSPEADGYKLGMVQATQSYMDLLERGVPAQDARGLLPTNVCTKIFWNMALSTLIHVYDTRVCCQAQIDEWIPVLTQMKYILMQRWPRIAALITAPVERGESCGYNASFDRPCVWRKR